MKKNYLLIIVFLLLGGGTAYHFLTKNNKTSKTTLGWDRKFAVDDANDIHKIFIAKRTGVTSTLERNGDHWLYNGQWKANPNSVKNLMEVLTTVTLKFVPPKAAIDNIVRDMASRGIKVEVYDKKGNKLKAFYVGDIGADGESTYMIMENSEQPMAVTLPHMTGHVRPRFEISGDQWRDKALFSYKPEEIKSVSIEYPKQRNKSFLLERKGNDFEVKPFYENVPAINRDVAKGRVEGFLVGFERLVAENYVNDYEHKDSIRNMIPFSIISVTDMDDNKKAAAFYQSYKINTATGERSADIVERYHADVSNGDWMLVQHRVFEKVFWPYEAFFEPAGQAVKD